MSPAALAILAASLGIAAAPLLSAGGPPAWPGRGPRAIAADREATAAAAKPDFSGRWVLIDPRQPPPDVAREMVVRESFRDRSVTGTPLAEPFITIDIERNCESGTKSESYPIGVAGGSVPGLPEGADPRASSEPRYQGRFIAKWNGDRLVIETGTYSGGTRESGPYTERLEVWSVEKRGTLSVTITDRSSTTEPKTAKYIYRLAGRVSSRQ